MEGDTYIEERKLERRGNRCIVKSETKQDESKDEEEQQEQQIQF